MTKINKRRLKAWIESSACLDVGPNSLDWIAQKKEEYPNLAAELEAAYFEKETSCSEEFLDVLSKILWEAKAWFSDDEVMVGCHRRPTPKEIEEYLSVTGNGKPSGK